ncbi:MAG TPA: nucleotidyltransferase family protein [Solirubrobacteraceae bacterium]|jgi:hypothetical protein
MSNNKAERRLILLSAGTAERREVARGRAAGLAREVDWPRLAATLYARRQLSLLGPRILELAGDTPSADFSEAVARAHEAGRHQGQLLSLLTLRILEMLAAAGIRSAPLKGPLLGEVIHGDPGRRLSSDVDVLVAPEQLNQAVEVARGLGYGAPTDHLLADGMPLLHLRMLDERGKLPPLELHWRVHWYERSFARERLLPAAAGPWAGWRPAPVNELAALLLFYARDGFIDLRIATDLSAWWDARAGELAPAALARLIEDHPPLARVLPAAAQVAENVVGLPAPRLLGDATRLGARERLAVKLANPIPLPNSNPSQLYADMGLIDGLLAPPGGFREFVARQLLPPAEVLDQQARHGRRRGARSSLVRFVGVLGRYGLTLARCAFRSPG